MKQFVIDAFESGPFTGNPAAVCPLNQWLPDVMMQSIAAENNLAETAFFVPKGDRYGLRWFSPTVEVPLCGHATLATSHVIFEELEVAAEALTFETQSGELRVKRGDAGPVMNFPASVPAGRFDGGDVLAALGVDGEVFSAGGDAFVVLESEGQVRDCDPDISALLALDGLMVVISAPSSQYDFVARVFAPQVGIDEDAATGAAHCALAPYWSERLEQGTVRSLQASKRGGYFTCRWLEDVGRVELAGSCRTFSRGEISV